MQPAMKYDVPVRVKNSYNPDAVGTIIRNKKESKQLVTAITYKRGIKLMDIHSTQMLGAYGFLAKVFGEFEKHKLSVDVLASSEVSVSLTLDKKQSENNIKNLITALQECAEIKMEDNKAIITLITDVQRSSEVLATVFRVFTAFDIKVEMMSQGASKVNISFIVSDGVLEKAITEIHRCFFEDQCAVSQTKLPDRSLVTPIAVQQ
jgi:aspartate kinase